MKKVLIISDLHCGHRAGLTPTDWQYNKNSEDKTRSLFGKLQGNLWQWYKSIIKSIGKIDILIVNGDATDGKGERSGSTELVDSDLLVQCDMAIKAIKTVNAKKTIMTYGTPYHTGKSEDLEDIVASKVDADIKGHHFIDINGCKFDIKHKVGSSTIPHGRTTSLLREGLWNDLWSLKENGQPKCDVLIRSHVHSFVYVGDDRRLALSTPALQTFGSKYGTRQCSGVVDIGMIEFDIDNKGGYSWRPHMFYSKDLKIEPQKL